MSVLAGLSRDRAKSLQVIADPHLRLTTLRPFAVYVLDRDEGSAALAQPIAEGADPSSTEDSKEGKKGNMGRCGAAPLRLGITDEAAIFSGVSKDHGDSIVCPLLFDHVAREIEKDASVLKQVRRAREKRRAPDS